MAEYRDIVVFRPRGGEKPFAQQIGSARMNDDGTIDLYFDSLPLPTKTPRGDIQVHARISPKRSQAGKQARHGGRGGSYEVDSGGAVPKDDDMDDPGIPF